MLTSPAVVELLQAFRSLPALAEIGRADPARRFTATGLSGPGATLLAAELGSYRRRPAVLVVADDSALAAAHADLEQLYPELNRLVLNPGLVSSVSALAALSPSTPAVVITLAARLDTPVPRALPADELSLGLAVGSAAALDRVVDWLEKAEYERTDLVTEPGEYATRGGIVDVFPEGDSQPARVEFLSDTVGSLRRFDPLSQRSVGLLNNVTVATRRRPEPTDRRAAELLPDGWPIVSTAAGGVEPTVDVVTDGPADLDFGCAAVPGYLGNFDLLRSELESSGLRWLVAVPAERIARLRARLPDGVAYAAARLSAGFTCRVAGIGLLTERELYGAPVRRAARPRFRGVPVDNLVTLRPGDHVVHVNYGIGRFEGTQRIEQSGVDKDFIVLAYAGRDRVFVPVENLGLLDRYVGSEEGGVRLDHIGGRSWAVAKAKAARASAEYAEELLDIHARRSISTGHAFAPDSEWQEQLEASFPFEETADQLAAMAAVRVDMERSRPMDRLVTGDVGYGKTEVALRAAFKAVSGMKQVALLVPTTILCYQHYTTFRTRLAPFPFRVEMVSRLRPPAERRRVLADLAAGKVDIVVGTHLLLSPSVRFRDLGLVIVDEEQKFGVRQKERIKQLRAAVDILTLTATPVPRTLYLALSGLRDISNVNTPPPGRREVLSEVSVWDDGLVAGYIERETARGGQVFFVHNRIATIGQIAERLRRLLPALDFAVAHGQMPGHELEDIYLAFAAGRHQVLLSTAIVESGLDLPNVNTIIVDRADHFGLADLHQLRGRVGRSGSQAYALFIVPPDERITPEARKRLSALLAYSRLGSGFKLAQRDLEIRGAGDLLGTRQHGHVARVGLHFYARMLKEAAARFKGEPVRPEPELALATNAYLPVGYVADGYERVALYRRLLAVESEGELDEFREELVDRFGRYPPVVDNLFKIALVRLRARKLGLLKVELRRDAITIVRAERTERSSGTLDDLLGRLADH